VAGGWVAQSVALSSSSRGAQYLALAFYVLMEVVIFLPILYIAEARFPGQHLALQAGALTLAVFAGLTFSTIISGKDFSFLGTILCVASWGALALVLLAVIFGFHLGLIFSFAMIALACGFIIYDTSNVMHQYRTDQHVAAALALFASVALLFYYILRVFIASRDE
jgi:hypothetical protein